MRSPCRAPTWTTSTRPQPVTHGAKPSRRHPPGIVRGGEHRRPRPAQAGKGHARPDLASTEGHEPLVPQRARPGAGHGADRVVVLGPHERGGQASAGERLEHGVAHVRLSGQAAGVTRTEQAVEAGVGEGVELRTGHVPPGLDVKCGGEQHVVGQTTGLCDRVVGQTTGLCDRVVGQKTGLLLS